VRASFGTCDPEQSGRSEACCFGNPALLGKGLVYRKSAPRWLINEKRGPVQIEAEVRQLGKSFSGVRVEFINGPTFTPRENPEEYVRWVASQFHEALADADRKVPLAGLSGNAEDRGRTVIESCLLFELPIVRIKAHFLLETEGFPAEETTNAFHGWLETVIETASTRLDHKPRRLFETEPLAPRKRKRRWLPW